MSKIAIITGGSHGIGNALVKQFLAESFQVYTLARTKGDIKHGNLKFISLDFNDLVGLETAFAILLIKLNKQIISEIVLVNNAGRLGEIAPIQKLKTSDVQQTINVNLTAPILLSSLFVQAFQEKPIAKQIINISSGAAVKPIASWAVYGTTKAGIDMFTKTLALEQNTQENPIKVIAIYPGVVDTTMQESIRNTDEKLFPNVARFQELHKSNNLLKPDYVAQKIYHFYKDTTLSNGTIIRVE